MLENRFIALTIVASVLGNSYLKGYTVVIILLPDQEESPSLGKNKRDQLLNLT